MSQVLVYGKALLGSHRHGHLRARLLLNGPSWAVCRFGLEGQTFLATKPNISLTLCMAGISSSGQGPQVAGCRSQSLDWMHRGGKTMTIFQSPSWIPELLGIHEVRTWTLHHTLSLEMMFVTSGSQNNVNLVTDLQSCPWGICSLLVACVPQLQSIQPL